MLDKKTAAKAAKWTLLVIGTVIFAIAMIWLHLRAHECRAINEGETFVGVGCDPL